MQGRAQSAGPSPVARQLSRPSAFGGAVSPRPPSCPQSGASPGRSPNRVSSVGAAPAKRAGSARPRSSCALPSPPLDDSDNIKVAVRVRPLNAAELARGDAGVLAINPEEPRQVVVTIPPAAGSAVPTVSHWGGSGSAPLPTSRSFQFHSCIGPEAGQDDVIRLCGIPQLLDAALAGYNATILAYGQTGSGKTYTISGREDEAPCGPGDDEGIVARSLAYVFAQVEAKNAAAAGDDGGDGYRYAVRASYSEIYNEALYDLLCFDQRQLSLRWDPLRGFHAPELTVLDCPALDDARDVVARGLRHRRVGSHALNLESSRSHSILTLHIDAAPAGAGADGYGGRRMGKVVFVDLAGSERLKDSLTEGSAMRETASINRSLFMLGKVISTLAAGGGRGGAPMVPYRESKLTKLLMDSLGGSALSLMIACCSPSAAHLEETLSTLSYATRAKNIRNAPAVQMDPQAAALAALRREVRVLRQENAFLREQLAGRGEAAPGAPGSPGAAAAALPAHSLMLRVPSTAQEELTRRLGDAQRLLGTLSTENARLAAENERLRAGGMQVAGEYSGAVEEIEWLRSKLARLETSLGAGGSGFGGTEDLSAVEDKSAGVDELPKAAPSLENAQPNAGGPAAEPAPLDPAEALMLRARTASLPPGPSVHEESIA